MMNYKIVIADPISKKGMLYLQEKGATVVDLSSEDKQRLLDEISDADALIVRSRTKVTREIIDAAKNLKVIARSGVGLDNIDVKYAKEKGIKVVNAVEAPANAVAELVLGFILALVRNIPRADSLLKKGEWAKSKIAKISHSLNGKTLGIIGYGRIGRKVGQWAKMLGMEVIAYDVIPLAGVEQVDLDELLQRADIITIHVPLLESTRGMFNKNLFEKMKDGVYLINTSRGPVIKEEDLKVYLKNGKIAAAALDVFMNEPNPDRDLVEMENVIATPHIGSLTIEAQDAITMETMKNLWMALTNNSETGK